MHFVLIDFAITSCALLVYINVKFFIVLENQAQDGSESRMAQHRGTSPALLPRSDSTNSIDSTSTPRGDVEEPGGIANDAEKVKLGLLFQTRNLDERVIQTY